MNIIYHISYHIIIISITILFVSCDSSNPTDTDNSSIDTIQGTGTAIIDNYTLQNPIITAKYSNVIGGYLTINFSEPETSSKQAAISITIPSSCLNLIGTYSISKQIISAQSTFKSPFVNYSDRDSIFLRQFETDSSHTGVILITECNLTKKRISGGFTFKAVRTDITNYQSGYYISGTVKLDNIFWK